MHFLETRLAYLESILTKNNIAFSPADEFSDLPSVQSTSVAISAPTAPPHAPALPASSTLNETGGLAPVRIKREPSEGLDGKKLDNLVADIGLVSFAGASDPRYLGSVSGISFARVVFAAVKSTASGAHGDQNGADAQKWRRRGAGRGARGGAVPTVVLPKEPETDADLDSQMRDSFFGLHTKPTISPAPFPTRAVAERLVNLYFEHANPQIPSLHRGEFNKVIDAVYSPSQEDDKATGTPVSGFGGSAREHYLLNIVCAIGAGIFMSDGGQGADGEDDEEKINDGPRKKQKVESKNRNDRTGQAEPESYHASAMVHLEAFLHQSKGGVEELQVVLLLAGYALLRPVSPGLWYIVGVAVRLAVDLGLHYEDADIEGKKVPNKGPKTEKEGKKEWARDMRRRLWWCVYNLDRLVSTCVGRPFGIADEVISTQVFPE